MTSGFDDEVLDEDDEDDGDDVTLVGGGGPASAMEDFEDDEGELDEHGDNLSRVDDDEL